MIRHALLFCSLATLAGCSDYRFDPGAEDGDAGSDITVNPAQVDFGEVYVGYEASQTLAIGNRGVSLLEIEDLVIDGPDSFYVVSSVDDVSTAEIEAGYNWALSLAFDPLQGDQQATLEIYSDDPDQPVIYVTLQGTGLLPY